MLKILIPLLLFANIAFAQINIALIAPLSGEHSAVGQQLLNGTKTAISSINQNGGINGQKINLVEIDDRCNDLTAISNAEMISLIREKDRKVSMIIGPYCQNSFQKSALIYQSAKIIQVIPTSISNTNHNSRTQGMLNLFAPKETQVEDFYKYYQKNFNNQNVAVVYNNNISDYQNMYQSLLHLFENDNKEAKLIAYNINDYNSAQDIADQIEQNQANIVYILGNPTEVIENAIEIKEQNKDIILFVDQTDIDDSFNRHMGSLANNTYIITQPDLKSNPKFAQEFVKLRLAGTELQGLAFSSYNAVLIWQELAKEANSFDYDKIIELISKKYIENQISKKYDIYKIENLEYKQVY